MMKVLADMCHLSDDVTATKTKYNHQKYDLRDKNKPNTQNKKVAVMKTEDIRGLVTAARDSTPILQQLLKYLKWKRRCQ